jgi:hypothetical protein
LRAVAGFRFQIFVDLPQRRLSMVADPRRRRPPRFRVENALEHGRIAFPPGRKDPLPPIRQEVNRDVKARLEDIDQASVDINVLFPTHVSSYCALRNLGFENALYRAYHRRLADFSLVRRTTQ